MTNRVALGGMITKLVLHQCSNVTAETVTWLKGLVDAVEWDAVE